MTIGTVILLPGLDGTGDLFAPFVNAAPPKAETIVVRYPLREVPIEDIQRHALAQLANPCIVVAESFSGPVGAGLAADARVRALVLCNSFIKSPIPAWADHVPLELLFALPTPRILLRHLFLGSQADQNLLEVLSKKRSGLFRSPFSICALTKIVWSQNAAVVFSGKPVLTRKLSG